MPRRDFALVSKEGLLREGPQCVGCRKPSWISIRRRTVLGVCGDTIAIDECVRLLLPSVNDSSERPEETGVLPGS